MDSGDRLAGFAARSGGRTTVEGPVTGELSHAGVSVQWWGLDPLPGTPTVLPLSRVRRSDTGAVDGVELAQRIAADPRAAEQLLPPFAAAACESASVAVAADAMGFRPVYVARGTAPSDAIVSTSALSAARALAAPLDEAAVAVQSLLGWQLGQRTLHLGVRKLEPGAVARVTADGVDVEQHPVGHQPSFSLEEAVPRAAALLRRSLESLLDEHPDAVLQLTGGQDSRLLLSAVPPARRRGLHAMTLGCAGERDVEVASRLAARDGLVHEVHPLAGADALAPAEAWERCLTSAMRLDATSDPVALAALDIAEGAFGQGTRISGLGGEIARGFYYFGCVHDRPYGRGDAERLAAWRMFVNDSIEPGAVEEEFARWSRAVAVDDVYESLRGGGDEWHRATDHLYLRHRMQRWAGVTDAAVADRRIVVNPMLHPEFLSIAARLVPADKAASRFLSLLQIELDPELARIPLEGRPAPVAYARPGLLSIARQNVSRVRKGACKAVQRARRGNRPPAGGAQLTRLVVEAWREDPARIVSGAADFVRADWLDAVLSGKIDPRPSSVGYVTNLVAAVRASAGSQAHRSVGGRMNDL